MYLLLKNVQRRFGSGSVCITDNLRALTLAIIIIIALPSSLLTNQRLLSAEIPYACDFTIKAWHAIVPFCPDLCVQELEIQLSQQWSGMWCS